MKKLILLTLFVNLCMVVFSQNAPKFVYCEIVGTSNFTNTKVTISIDYGDPKKFGSDAKLRTEDGKIQKFNSMIDALNYMGKQGWEFTQAYAVTVSNQNVYHYLLKKPFVDLTPEMQDIILKE